MSTVTSARLATRHQPGSRHTVVDSPLGDLTVVALDDALTGVYFGRQWRRPAAESFGPRDHLVEEPFAAAAAQLAEYFAGERTAFELPLRASGSAFERDVWTLLRDIPYAATTSYGAIATTLGDRALARDVGQAVGSNPLGVVVPCHRVIGADGSLVGYAGGLERKRYLLDLEAFVGGRTLLDPRAHQGTTLPAGGCEPQAEGSRC